MRCVVHVPCFAYCCVYRWFKFVSRLGGVGFENGCPAGNIDVEQVELRQSFFQVIATRELYE